MASVIKMFANRVIVKNTFIEIAEDDDLELEGEYGPDKKCVRQVSEPAYMTSWLDEHPDVVKLREDVGHAICPPHKLEENVSDGISTPTMYDSEDDTDGSTMAGSSFSSLASVEHHAPNVYKDTCDKNAQFDSTILQPSDKNVLFDSTILQPKCAEADRNDRELPQVCYGFVLTPICATCGNQVQSSYNFCIWCGSRLKQAQY
eukprot:TRINITY_DN8792_c0_g1_i2.p1 TRINITY_DN8792_c0_g1~~TRINITY_DN8792_c0_g1_i2.p1  ORF type:complete len:203 (+),score=39.20 TRINITY_DN8792_c0_g1_i2:94-702(+)